MSIVEALLFERAGYLRRGLEDRVKQVDEALAREGYKPVQEPVKRGPGRPRKTAEA